MGVALDSGVSPLAAGVAHEGGGLWPMRGCSIALLGARVGLNAPPGIAVTLGPLAGVASMVDGSV